VIELAASQEFPQLSLAPRSEPGAPLNALVVVESPEFLPPQRCGQFEFWRRRNAGHHGNSDLEFY
jgi:hypothetical protein